MEFFNIFRWPCAVKKQVKLVEIEQKELLWPSPKAPFWRFCVFKTQNPKLLHFSRICLNLCLDVPVCQVKEFCDMPGIHEKLVGPLVDDRNYIFYVNEFDFRWNTRKLNDGDRTLAAIQGAVGKRLDYKTQTQ